ncbi:hypothetical protein [uncultured Fibrobacter sp.]|uniref:hypothetical protein n=1 Tax=uncultured Fibrobacter sp. TaxID=261512 RepID=UPI0025FBECBA|nr:hypothetical protein [uncultured Fibrobacter sp.]
MKKIFFAFIMAFTFIGCDSSSSPSVNEPEIEKSSDTTDVVTTFPVDSFDVEFPGLLISHGLYFSEIRSDSQGHFRIALINENYNITNFRITYTVRDTDVPVIKYTEERYAEFNSDLIILVPEAIWNWTITITKIEFMVNTKGDYQTVWKGSFNIDKYTKV